MKKIIYYLFFILLGYSCLNNSLKENIKVSSYNGVITDKYEDRENHSISIFVIKKNGGKYIEEAADLFYGSWQYADVGDSIIKEKGKMYITIKRKRANYKTSVIFNYK